MCSRFDTIPACDGQTDRQTDRQTSCYSICAMHNVARKKQPHMSDYPWLEPLASAWTNRWLNYRLPSLDTRTITVNAKFRHFRRSAIYTAFNLRSQTTSNRNAKRRLRRQFFSHRFNNACLHEFRVHFYVIVLPMNSIASTSVSLLFSRHSKIHCDNDATP